LAYVNIEDLSKSGGGKIHFWAMARRLARLGHTVDILAPKYGKESWLQGETDGLTHLGVPVPTKGPLGVFCFELAVLLLLPYLRLRRGCQAMLVRGGGVGVMPGLVYLVARALGIRVVLECNGVVWDEFAARGACGCLSAWVRLAAWQEAFAANAIIGVTPSICDAYASLAGRSRRAAVPISNGADFESFRPETRQQQRAAWGFAPDQLVVVMPSSFAPWHAVDALISAAAQVPADVRERLRIVLPGQGPFRDQAQRQVQRLGLEENVDLPGQMSHADIRRLLPAADVGVILRPHAAALKYPGSPLKLFEYLAAGLEVLVPPDSYHARLVPFYGFGKVLTSTRPADIAQALAACCRDRRDYPRRMNIRRIAREEFDWSVVARRVEAVLAGRIPRPERWLAPAAEPPTSDANPAIDRDPLAGKRILQIANEAGPLRLFMLPICRHLARRGARVEMACMAAGPNWPGLQACELPVHGLAPCDRTRPWGMWKLYRQVRRLLVRGRYDIVVVHTPVMSWLTRYAGRDLPGKMVYMAHGLPFLLGRKGLRNEILRRIETFCGRWTDALMVMNAADARAAQRLPLVRSGGLVRKVPGVGVDVEAWSAPPRVANR
jgi:glycosyltransferase involved in cell wall biosynthesis